MASARERARRRCVAGYAVLVSLLVFAAALAWQVAPRHYAAVAHMAASLLVAVVLRHGTRVFKAWLAAEPAVPADEPPVSPAGTPAEALFGRLREELRHGSARRRYFVEVLWPRLCRLAALRRRRLPPDPTALLDRRRRGPSLRRLSALIAAIEGPEAREDEQ